jgi:amidohydrolase
MPPRTELRRLVADILPEIIALRHSLHRIPETHYEERETAETIRAFLAGTRVEILPPLLGTDTVGLLHGASPGPCILLRSDIDGLPIEEKTGKAWSSTHPGKAHACGHDGHVAILLGTARVLDDLAGSISGSVRFVFQPAEEEAHGGHALIEKGLLEIPPRPEAAFALHGWVGIPEGKVSAAPGAMMAAADRFTITVRGRGGHAALPHRMIDPVVTAAQVIVGLQTVVSRSVDPLEAVVISVCRVEGGKTSNVIPDEVVLEGTTRYFDPRMESPLREKMGRVVAGICASGGCAHELAFMDGYVPLINHASAVAMARTAVATHLGPGAWTDEHPPTMGAEDFGFFLQKVPGALLRLGLGQEWHPLHSPGFDFNDQSLEPGIVTLAGLALDFCSR